MKIEFVQASKVYFGGELVKGKIKVHTEKPLITRSFVVILAACEKTQVEEYSVSLDATKLLSHPIGAIKPKKVTYKSQRNFITLQCVLLGSLWSKREEGSTVQIGAGDTEFPYTFRLPPLIPATVPGKTNIDNEYELSYTLTARFDSPSFFSFNETAWIRLRVGGCHLSPLALSNFLTPKPLTYRTAKAFAFEEGRLLLRATVYQKANHFGDECVFSIEVTNNSKQEVAAISFSLSQSVQITAMGHPDLDTTTLSLTKKIPLVVPARAAAPVTAKFNVTIPHNKLLPDIASTLINITHCWKVELHVASLLSFNPILKIPMMLFHKNNPPAPSSTPPSSQRIKSPPAVSSTPLIATVPAVVHHVYDNGDVYDGEWLYNKPHGPGVLIYASGDAFSGTWKHGVPADGSYSFADVSQEFSDQNVKALAPAEPKKTSVEPLDPNMDRELLRLLFSSFPLQSPGKPVNPPPSFFDFIAYGVQCEEPQTQTEAIHKFLLVRTQFAELISNMLSSGDLTHVSTFGNAVHEHYGVFFLLWQYFNPNLVRKWTNICLPHLEGVYQSTMTALLMVALALTGEFAELLTNIEAVNAKGLEQRSQVANIILSEVTAIILAGRLDLEGANQSTSEAITKCTGAPPLLRAQILLHATSMLGRSDSTFSLMGAEALSTKSLRSELLQELCALDVEKKGIYGQVAAYLTMKDRGEPVDSWLSYFRSAWELGSLDAISPIAYANRHESLLSRLMSLSIEAGWASAGASYNYLLINRLMEAPVANSTQIYTLLESFLTFCECGVYTGEARTIYANSTKFQLARALNKPLEAVQALEAAITHFYDHYAKTQKEEDINTNTQSFQSSLDIGADMDEPIETHYETTTNGDSVTPSEVSDTAKEGESTDVVQAKKVVEESWKQRPSAMLLRSMRGLCSCLVSAAPRAPRTMRILLDLLECGTRWAALGWDAAILFCVYLTCTRSKICKELGETSTAISWCKNALQMMDEHKIKSDTENHEEADDEKDPSFEDIDYSHGILQFRLEAVSLIALYLDFPLAQHAESQKWFEHLLQAVDYYLGKTELPRANAKLHKKEALLWDKKAVALRGIASCIFAQDTTHDRLLYAQAIAEQAMQLGKLLNFSSARVKTQESTLSKITKKLTTSVDGSIPTKPATMPAQPPSTKSASPTATPATSNTAKPQILKWMSDEETTACMQCQIQFSFFTRKHHCRACGKVVCDACSPAKLLPQYGTTPQRTCSSCSPDK